MIVSEKTRTAKSVVRATCFTEPGTCNYRREPGIFYNVPWLTAITNGDSGAAILSQLDISTGGQTPQPLNQISYVSQDGLDSQVTLAIDPTVNNWWSNPVSLSLQREDGSYIEADKEGNLFAIGADGSVVWQQQLGGGALTPLYATADGGAIVTTTTAPCQPTWVVAPFGTPPCPLGSQSRLGTLYTVDQNGNVTSQTPDTGTIYSWKAAYIDPQGASIGAITSDLPPLVDTSAAVADGDFAVHGAATHHATIGLAWCGSETNYGETGSCSGINDLAGADVQFGYEKALGTSAFQSFATDHPAWVDIIENAALDALSKAFKPFPIMVRTMKPSKEGTDKGKVKYPVFVVGDNWAQPEAGWSPNFSLSFVFYLPIMGNAQVALGAPPHCGHPPCGGWNNLSPTYPPSTQQDEANFERLMRATGRGIGNIAAHELGHQFGLQFIDCGSKQAGAPGTTCQNGNNFVYEFFSGSGEQYTGPDSGGAQFKYTDVPGEVLQWSPSDKNSINCRLSPWWKQLLGIGPCGS